MIVVIKQSQEHIDIDTYTHARTHARTHNFSHLSVYSTMADNVYNNTNNAFISNRAYT